MSKRIPQHDSDPTPPLRHWLGLALLMLLTLSSATQAATITVNSLADPGVADDNFCTLREALAAINAGANDASDCLKAAAMATAPMTRLDLTPGSPTALSR